MMTDLELELRELMHKYKMDVCEISILFNNNGRNILAISFDEMEEGNNDTRTNRQFNCRFNGNSRI